jgi:hypothetical protein
MNDPSPAELEGYGQLPPVWPTTSSKGAYRPACDCLYVGQHPYLLGSAREGLA